MEKTIITFSANEQKLIKTGGIECYASNIVSYIEAHFDLGANWSGYDSVRAVWSNDNNMSVISTVLDSNGVCVVPFEVLKTKGIVKVNLVGSISVSDVLTDRLTTFPCEAVKVTAKAKIEGSETQPITPSQFEQFVAVVIAEVEKVTGMTAQAETLPAGSQATARYENGVLYLGIPQGIQGETGNGIASVSLNSDYTLTITMTDGTSYTTASIRGEKGEKGDTGERGPIGPQGETGPQGPKGDQGIQGIQGETGATPNLTIGTVETLAPTEDATASITGTAENPVLNLGLPKGDTGEVSLEDLGALLPTETASGEIVTITDGQSVVPAKSLKVALEPIQDLNGYDKPWSGGAGKNKFGGVYGQKYELHIPSGATVTAYVDKACTLAYYEADGTTRIDYWSVSTEVAGGYTRTFTMIGDSSYFMFLGVPDPPTKMYIAIENSFSGYAPYSNICPISGHTEVNTYRTGKNLWDDSIAPTDIEAYSLAGNAGTYKGRNLHLPNGTYTFSYNGTANSYVYGNVVNADGSWVSTFRLTIGVSGTRTPTITLSVGQYAKLYMASGAVSELTSGKIQLEVGTTATDYEPYQGTTYTTPLGRTVYGGTLDVVSGALTVDRAMVDLGSLNWRGIGLGAEYARFVSSDISSTVKTPPNNATPTTAICEQYSAIGASNLPSNNGTFGVYTDGDIGIKDESYADVASFKTAMNGVQLCYELATPQTYQLDPQTIDLLLGDNNVWSDGKVTLTYSADIQKWVEKKLNGNSTTLTMSRPMTEETE